MSELPAITDLAWNAAHAANRAFDDMQRTETDLARSAATAEFIILLDMAEPAINMPEGPFIIGSLGFQALQAYSEQGKTLPEKQLAMPIDALLDSIGPIAAHPLTRSRTRNRLKTEGVKTLRDVLVVGRGTVTDMRNIAEKSVEYLAKVIKKVDPKLTWRETPTATDIARLCTSLDQVPARAFDKELDAYSTVRNAQQLLSMPIEVLAEILRERSKYRDSSDKKVLAAAEQIHTRVQRFAKDFMDARAAL